ncbi:MAG: type II CRISPR-associated endonuclease Cas1 [Gammaproteobacteria bacterium]
MPAVIKRSLYFSKAVYLRKRHNQLEALLNHSLVTSAPIEDLGFVILDHPQIQYSQSLLIALIENNTAVIYCDAKHMPTAVLLNLSSHHLQQELHRTQIQVKIPAKKALWKSIVEYKIRNQIGTVKSLGLPVPPALQRTAREVKSGDTSNREAVAAKLYWQAIMPKGYTRNNPELLANKLLNYGYTILRSAVARALTGSGLLPTVGIHHRNQYNSFALADDIMEPYRPFVDKEVVSLCAANSMCGGTELSREHKKALLEILAMDVYWPNKKRPLANGLSLTTASLARYFADRSEAVIFPSVG